MKQCIKDNDLEEDYNTEGDYFGHVSLDTKER